MCKTESTMLPLGTRAPSFHLVNIDEKRVRLEDHRGHSAYCVMFLCNHCPFVIHLRKAIAELAREYREKAVAFFAISSNDVEAYPQDSPSRMAAVAREEGFIFPYLYDSSQAIAIAYQAACTPDFYVFDKDMLLVYRGQFDDSRPGNGKPVTGADLRLALDLAIEGQRIPDRKQRPSLGCNIKWKPGNAPAYFAGA